ncbi:MAG: two-component regulator propeller domain-containing protein, partial [Bacteroidota bacterium]
MDYFTKCILEDDSGNIWIGTLQSGIIIINRSGKVIRKINKIENQKIQQVGCFFSDRNKQMWISTDAGLFLYKPSSKGFEKIKTESTLSVNQDGSLIYRIVETGKEEYICGSKKNLLRLKKNNEGIFELTKMFVNNMI